MPSTTLGLVIFVISLAPGLVYILMRERVAPHTTLSAFRESAIVLCASLAADAVVLTLLAALRVAAPQVTPDVGALIRTPTEYLASHYVLVFWWSLGLLATASALAAWVGSGAARRLLSRLLQTLPAPLARFRVASEATPHDANVSGWWLAFNEVPATDVHVGCALADGSFVSGYLVSHSRLVDDSPDRDLVLGPPITFRPAESDVAVQREGVGAVVVSARQIAVLFVSYVKNP